MTSVSQKQMHSLHVAEDAQQSLSDRVDGMDRKLDQKPEARPDQT